MKQSAINKAAKNILGAMMKELGFEMQKETYFRLLPSGVIHLMSMEHDPHTNETFRVMCGINSTVVGDIATPRALGYVGARHLTRSGWDCGSGRWPCANDDDLKESFSMIHKLIPNLVEPWFQEHKTLSSVADEEEERFGIDKARLYLADNNIEKARGALKTYLQSVIASIANPKSWDDPQELEEEKTKAEAMLAEIST